MINKEYKEAMKEVLRNLPPKAVDWKGSSQIWNGLVCIFKGVILSIFRLVVLLTLPLSLPYLAHLLIMDKKLRQKKIDEWESKLSQRNKKQ